MSFVPQSSFNCNLTVACHMPGTDLAQRFSDQFRPLEVNSRLSWARPDATIVRMPLRSAEQAAERKFEDGVACTDADIARILNKFKIRASSALLFLQSVEDVRVSCFAFCLVIILDVSYSGERAPSMNLTCPTPL